MANHMRCPGCHLRMRPTMTLLVEQARLEWAQGKENAAAAQAAQTVPQAEAASFPCQRCGTPIDRASLVRREYDERLPLAVVLEVPLVGIAVAWLFGWLYGWGAIAGAVVGLIAGAFSVTMLVTLHHYFTENRKLRQLGLPSSRADWSEAAAFVAIALLMPGVATLGYRTLGWGGLACATVIGIALLVHACFGEEPIEEGADNGKSSRGAAPIDDAARHESKARMQ